MEAGSHSPVEAYRLGYGPKFAELTKDFLDSAVNAANIDESANAALSTEIRKLEGERDHVGSKLTKWYFLLTFIILGMIAWGCVLWYQISNGNEITALHWCGFAATLVISLLFIIYICYPRIKELRGIKAKLEEAVTQKTTEALKQLRPLYRQFDWNTITNLIEETMPQLKFDDFLPEERLSDICGNFGFALESMNLKSVLYSHSGTLYGYPFIFLETKSFRWISKTYYGHKTIHWTEREKGSDGKMRTVHKSEVLTASVTKPFPEFYGEKTLLFGHEAAPELSFSRSPSSLSGASNSIFTSLGKKVKMNKLHRFERNLTDSSNFTMMSNRDFELLFCSTDRDNEVEYRLLFTPLAQQYMVELLNDRKTGYGDDFQYNKKKKLTTVISSHLQKFDFSTEPRVLKEYCLETVRKILTDRFNEFFRSVYFSLAPLLAIPLYNEPRTGDNICGCKADSSSKISYMEMESIANYQGETYYKHPDSVTDNLLKVHNVKHKGNETTATVTAFGFAGIDHTVYISVYGGDHRSHDVPVNWVEYKAVDKTSRLSAYSELAGGAGNTADEYTYRRRSILSFPPD